MANLQGINSWRLQWFHIKLLVSMHGLQTFAFLKAGKVNQRIDSPCAPVSKMIKADITELIGSLASTTGQLNVMNVMAGCPICLYSRILGCFLLHVWKKKDVTRKGGGSFVDQGVWMLTGSGLKLAFAHRCSRGPDHMQTDSRVHEGNERQQ